MDNWIARSLRDWRTAARQRRDVARLADLPDHLLHDIGIRRDGAAPLRRQARERRRGR